MQGPMSVTSIPSLAESRTCWNRELPCPNGRCLSISGNNCVSILRLSIQNESARILKVKNVSVESLTQNGLLDRLLRKHRSLSSITIENLKAASGHMSLSKLPMSLLFENPTLSELSIMQCRLADNDISCIFDSAVRSKSLTSLSLVDMGIGFRHVQKLAQLLQKNDRLKTLNLSKNDLDGRSIKALSESLKVNVSLCEISLAWNSIGDEGALYLTGALQQNRTLRRCDLEHAEIWHSGCRYLARGLCKMHGIRVLGLEGNDMEHCATDFLASAKVNMEIIYISGTCPLAMDGSHPETLRVWKEVEYWLHLNRANRRILTIPNKLALWPIILERIKDDNDAIYYLIRHAPHIGDSLRIDQGASRRGRTKDCS